VKLATPEAFTATVVSVLDPTLNFTLPVGIPAAPLRVTVAFSVQGDPWTTVLGVAVSATPVASLLSVIPYAEEFAAP
jgi:hypothetical protein